MKTTIQMVAIVIAVAAGIALLDRVGIVCLRYPSPYDNEPLNVPEDVAKVVEGRLTLTDGRTLVWDGPVDDLGTKIAASDKQVELVQQAVAGTETCLMVYGKRQLSVCGTPYVALISVPVIPHRIPKYGRVLLGAAHIAKNEGLGGQHAFSAV